MSRPSYFKVIGSFDRARLQDATVIIERGLDPVFRVRPKHSRRTYDLPLSSVAAWVVQRVVKAEIFRKKMEKAKEKKARRGR